MDGNRLGPIEGTKKRPERRCNQVYPGGHNLAGHRTFRGRLLTTIGSYFEAIGGKMYTIKLKTLDESIVAACPTEELEIEGEIVEAEELIITDKITQLRAEIGSVLLSVRMGNVPKGR